MTTEHQCPCGKKTFETVGSLINGRWHCFTCAQKARESVTSNQYVGAKRYKLTTGHSDDAGLGGEGWVVRMSDHFPSFDTAQKWVKAEDYEALRLRFEKACARVTELESAQVETTPQAPIAKVIVREDGPADVMLYAPGLPPGEHDLYCEPPAPGGQKVPHPCFAPETGDCFERAYHAVEERLKDFGVFAVDIHRHEWAAIKQELQRLAPETSDDPHGPPFTVDRFGSLAECVIAERNWLRKRLADHETNGIRQLFNKGIGVQKGNRFSFSFETEEEATRAFHYIADLGTLETSRPPLKTSDELPALNAGDTVRLVGGHEKYTVVERVRAYVLDGFPHPVRESEIQRSAPDVSVTQEST